MTSFVQNSFLAGLAALAVPILIHLFFRLKTKRVELGTIRFLRVVMEENARRRKVMRWLLLALRMAFVALLVGLFARPYLRAAATTGQKELLVILIDQSATMQLKGERRRLLDHAVAEARKLIESAASGTRFEVALFDHQIRPLVVKDESGATRSESILSQLQVPPTTFGATNYGSAIAWARDICVKAPAGGKQVHLFTDLQRSGLDWTEVEPFPEDVQAHLHDLGNAVVNNVAVAEIRTPKLWIHPGDAPVLQTSIQYNGAVSLNDVPIVLEVGRVDGNVKPGVTGEPDSPVKSADFARLSERITKRERVKLEPGATVTLDFELPPLSEGLWQGRITAEYDDDQAFDNQRFLAIAATPAYRILVLNGGDSDSALSSETYFLETALRLAVPGESFHESPFAPTVIPYTAGTVLPDLADFDAVVLANVGELSRDDAGRLARSVRLGGGLLVFTGDKTTAGSCSALADEGLTVGTIRDTKVTVDLPWKLSKWDETHPVLQPLSDPQHGDLRRLIFAAYTQLSPAPGANVLLEFGTGDPAIVESHVGEGKVIWVTVSCGRDWSDWSRSRLFLPLVHQLLGYEVGLTQGGRVRTRIIDSNPTSSVEAGQVRMPPSEQRQSVSVPFVPGVYQLPHYSEVVNTSPRESDVDRCSREEFENRFAMRFVDESGVATTPGVATHAEFHRDEIWHWVACALLAVLLLEGFVGNRTTA
ncbi:MAG: BatA domain-containing protein [Planctomycetes bacterium]|nr:BatA domain-containing protein [Planctomycetota bacterium]